MNKEPIVVTIRERKIDQFTSTKPVFDLMHGNEVIRAMIGSEEMARSIAKEYGYIIQEDEPLSSEVEMYENLRNNDID